MTFPVSGNQFESEISSLLCRCTFYNGFLLSIMKETMHFEISTERED